MTKEQIRSERKKRGLTQKQVADMCMVHSRTYQRWEGGEVKISKWSEYDLKRALKAFDRGNK